MASAFGVHRSPGPSMADPQTKRQPANSVRPMRVEVAAKTDVGLKRTHNEDNYFLLDEDNLFIVADGMGGHSSGEVASKMATEAIAEFFQRTRDAEATWPYKMDRNLSYVENRLVCGIKLANHR